MTRGPSRPRGTSGFRPGSKPPRPGSFRQPWPLGRNLAPLPAIKMGYHGRDGKEGEDVGLRKLKRMVRLRVGDER